MQLVNKTYNAVRKFVGVGILPKHCLNALFQSSCHCPLFSLSISLTSLKCTFCFCMRKPEEEEEKEEQNKWHFLTRTHTHPYYGWHGWHCVFPWLGTKSPKIHDSLLGFCFATLKPPRIDDIFVSIDSNVSPNCLFLLLFIWTIMRSIKWTEHTENGTPSAFNARAREKKAFVCCAEFGFIVSSNRNGW